MCMLSSQRERKAWDSKEMIPFSGTQSTGAVVLLPALLSWLSLLGSDGLTVLGGSSLCTQRKVEMVRIQGRSVSQLSVLWGPLPQYVGGGPVYTKDPWWCRVLGCPSTIKDGLMLMGPCFRCPFPFQAVFMPLSRSMCH